MFKIQIKMVQKTGVLSPLIHFIVSLGIAGAIWLGSYLIVTHQITSGNFVSFIAALLMKSSTPLSKASPRTFSPSLPVSRMT